MTSAQNRRPPLNGSKYIALLICVSLFSCNIIKSNPVEPPVRNGEEEVVIDKNEPNPDQPKKHVPFKETKQEVFFHGKSYMVPAKKEQFKIALILPFHYGFKTKNQKRVADIMMEYYKGMKMALEELETAGFNAIITVYDNKNDSNELKRILRKREIYKMDLVIGPIQTKQVEIVSRVLKPYKIPVFSPFTAIDALSDPNPLMYSFIGGEQIKAQQFVNYLEKHHKGEKLVILRDGRSFDRSFVPSLVAELDKSDKISYVKEAYKPHIAWTSLLPKDKNSLVFIASTQQNTVQNSLGGLVASKRDLTVFGDDSWLNFTDNDFMFWDRLNMHIVGHEFNNPRDTLMLHFRLQFRETYHEDPSDFALRGYDQISFIGDVLMAFGEHFPLFIENQHFEYSATAFEFAPLNGCRQNRNQIILHYKDHQLEVAE